MTSSNISTQQLVIEDHLTATGNHLPYGWYHIVLPATRQQLLPPLHQLKLALDLATPEGCKAELTCD